MYAVVKPERKLDSFICPLLFVSEMVCCCCKCACRELKDLRCASGSPCGSRSWAHVAVVSLNVVLFTTHKHRTRPDTQSWCRRSPNYDSQTMINECILEQKGQQTKMFPIRNELCERSMRSRRNAHGTKSGWKPIFYQFTNASITFGPTLLLYSSLFSIPVCLQLNSDQDVGTLNNC